MTTTSKATRCRRCGDRVEWRPSRNAWVHAQAGHDHPPIPEATS